MRWRGHLASTWATSPSRWDPPNVGARRSPLVDHVRSGSETRNGGLAQADSLGASAPRVSAS
eukprot:6184686-Prymnesium_polylepis.1